MGWENWNQNEDLGGGDFRAAEGLCLRTVEVGMSKDSEKGMESSSFSELSKAEEYSSSCSCSVNLVLERDGVDSQAVVDTWLRSDLITPGPTTWGWLWGKAAL